MAIGRVITDRFALSGVAGIDMARHDGRWYVLEVNPRYPASAQLLDELLDPAVMTALRANLSGKTSLAPGSQVVGEYLQAAGVDPPLAHDRAGAQRVDDADARGVEAAEDDGLVDVGDELLDLGGRHEPRRGCPRIGHSVLKLRPAPRRPHGLVSAF